MADPVNKSVILLMLALCGPAAVSQLIAAEKYLKSDDSNISQGRELWLQNCESCHGYGIADAPVPMNPEDWDHRLNKDKQLLYDHAINGFIGPDYSMMPARGGNENLDDNEVKLAVDYMTFLAGYYMNKHELNKEVKNDSTTN